MAEYMTNFKTKKGVKKANQTQERDEDISSTDTIDSLQDLSFSELLNEPVINTESVESSTSSAQSYSDVIMEENFDELSFEVLFNVPVVDAPRKIQIQEPYSELNIPYKLKHVNLSYLDKSVLENNTPKFTIQSYLNAIETTDNLPIMPPQIMQADKSVQMFQTIEADAGDVDDLYWPTVDISA